MPRRHLERGVRRDRHDVGRGHDVGGAGGLLGGGRVVLEEREVVEVDHLVVVAVVDQVADDLPAPETGVFGA